MLREIENYYKKLENYKHYSFNETSIRSAFQSLLDSYSIENDLILIPELAYDKNNIPDGTIKDKFRFNFGYWEAKDEKDNLDIEIDKKLLKGYPSDNIIFEDSKRAVLIQNGVIILDIDMQKSEKLKELLDTFFSYEKLEILEFNKAIEKFREDIPNIIKPINLKIEIAYKENDKFKKIYNEFIEICKYSIDKNISKLDIFEMLLQHILTEDIFKVVFDDSEFHLHNNIAIKLNELETTILSRVDKKNLFSTIRYYYEAIKSHSLALNDYKEKQKFLNTLYENFYKAYNPKRADKLGIVYTPLEIVDFMIESVDFLLYKHFNKTLSSKNVKILDPSTGTGTFLTQIIDYIPANLLEHKYKNELFANEISILPYYIANLNLEYIYQQKMKTYAEFENISFTDTLELNQNIKGQGDLFSFSSENLDRIKKQEDSEINIIIGNPPYNANQQNENDNNKNKEYPFIDKRIKNTYVKNSTAQKTKVYDMYSRFYRWSSDRLKDEGIIAFITNSSFIDSKTFDGFRKSVFSEFNEIYVIDLGGNVRKNPKLSGTRNNVFNIQTGVAILILIKKENNNKCKLFYLNPFNELEIKYNKLQFLKNNKFENLIFDLIIPDKRNNWLNQTNNDWDKLISMGTKECKANKQSNAIFRLYSNGISTNRDEWVYDFDKNYLLRKIKFFIDKYNKLDSFDTIIKWSRNLKNNFNRNNKSKFEKNKIRKSLYRPFINKFLFFDNILNDEQGKFKELFPTPKSENIAICIDTSDKPFSTLIADRIMDIHFNGDSQSFAYYIYDKYGERYENITFYGLKAFQAQYEDKTITKEDIFNYCYGVLHYPKYRKKYEINLKQDLPRIPFYEDFRKFVKVGKELIDIHINFETIEKYPLKEIKQDSNKPNISKLKLSQDKTEILIDEITILGNFPKEALEYKLGNRSAIEWVLDGYKEKKIKDPTVNEKFNDYKFSDYKKQVIDLLKRVTTVSLKTNQIINEIDKDLN